MELWALITIAAAFLQNVRSMMQKYLKGAMGTTGATFVRFGFGLPFVVLYLALTLHFTGYALPALNAGFMLWALIGGTTQIAATFLLVHLFSFRNFAVGTAYSRTEPAQAALFALVLFGETISAGAVLAIAISVVGVMLISVARIDFSWRAMVVSTFSRTALIGLASGALFGVSSVTYRAASLSLGGPHFAVQAATTLAFVIIVQTVAMLAWIVWKEREELVRIRKAWKPSLLVGIAGASASFGWFSAMTLQQAAVVKALAQVEMLFAFATTIFFFKERVNRFEFLGCALIVFGILVLARFG
ncbi:DMT family transporter [Limoniibacter endophyticus]|uniref:Membrane protein n=1 Tax=Limoniibacter endophyticus TaxID=1565040 RepID=A0A8J3DQQ7_9HYPH|nr:DMT family transporter [Limoniibacter endophyticus]GHC67373.1 membrane protein [Limoniibacter endophyticus]